MAPASTFDAAEFEKGIACLRNLGFEPAYDDSLFARHLYFAGTDAQRAEQLIHTLKDDNVRAVFCVRGGYGATRLLPYLRRVEWSAPKIFMGSSDITALLAFFSSEQRWVSFHGPMVAGDIARMRIDVAQWAAFLGGGRFPASIRNKTACWRSGEGRGILCGGCLSILCSLLGTGTRWEMVGAPDLVLFLEDIRCRPYQVDRMLTQLVQSGVMERVRGVIFGEMIECGSRADLKPMVLDALAPFQFPIVFGLPSGHTSGESLILPLGVAVRLQADENLITFLESPVEE
ncbi:MAG: LD-carboxypeptidase [Acidobacteria bacterium]|nr:LD-carboxypeptidase [Acidobacteriota bacterium]